MIIRSVIFATILAGSTSFSHADDNFNSPVNSGPDWNGWYWGAQIGSAQADHSVAEVYGPGGTFNPIGPVGNHEFSGAAGGAHIGIRLQNNRFVLGLEADANLANLSNTAGPFAIGDDFIVLESDWYATARVTAGVTHGSALFYGTAGGAWMGADLGFFDPVGISINAVNSKTLSGWVVGAGVEVMAASDWSWKIEYLHMDFEDVDTFGISPGFTDLNVWSNEVTLDTIMLKVSKNM